MTHRERDGASDGGALGLLTVVTEEGPSQRLGISQKWCPVWLLEGNRRPGANVPGPVRAGRRPPG